MAKTSDTQTEVEGLETRREADRQVDHWSADEILGSCPSCEAFAVVALTERLTKLQRDGTTHVCHPGFGGCNQGFALT